jgi:hypothetical protein
MHGNVTNTQDYLKDLPDWQVKNLQLFQKLVHDTLSDVSEEVKWGVPVFIYKGKTLFTMGSFKAHTKYNFILNGAALEDPHHLFNNGLESAKSRAIDLQVDQSIDTKQLTELIQAASEALK